MGNSFKTTQLTRTGLYRLAVERLDDFGAVFSNIDFIKQIFQDSASIIEPIENILSSNEKNQLSLFYRYFEEGLKKVKDDSFKEYIYSSISKKMDEEIRNKPEDYFEYLSAFLISSIAKYQNRIIEKNYIKSEEFLNNSLPKPGLPKTFLSYAFDDKGLSLALYFYFALRGGFLYVDWMWHGKIKNSKLLKESIYYEISSSDQFLFARTTASELQVKNGVTIRQWCSWEIGNFYSKDKDKKFMIAFYNPNTTNQILETFKIMDYVENGIIVPV